MKTFIFMYEDVYGNELLRKTDQAKNYKDARRIADLAYANTKLNDLFHIRIKKQ